MAAYSAVACLRQTLQQLLDSDEFPDDFPKPETQYLLENISILQNSLDRAAFVPKKWRHAMYELQTKIREAIYEAQDKAEYSIKGHFSPAKYEKKTLKEIVAEIDAITKETAELAETIINDPEAQDTFSEIPQQSRFNFSGMDKNKIVGQEEDIEKIIELLTLRDRNRLVISITGLPGLGKTTLARNIYDNQAIYTQFNIRAWVTVSQDFTYQEIFSKILSTMESKNYKEGHYARQGDEQTLLSHLYQELYNLKYLIVVDDVWEERVWDKLMQALPDKKNGSRVILTTRISTVAASIQGSGFIHTMKPLNFDNSWKLLCYKVFNDTDEACPPHLRDIGKRIAEKCNGLPLSITVVGGLLSRKTVNIEYWKRIEDDVGEAVAQGGDESYLQVLSLSYISLPGKLKACFLYMGAFPEDSEISVSKLIKLWVAEGFLTSPADVSLEIVARRSLEDLIGRNLISLRKKSSNGGIKVCSMHDSLRELAENESRKEKFFHSRKWYGQKQENDDMQNQRRVSVHRNILMCLEDVYNSTQSIKDARSLLYLGPHHHHPLSFCLTFDLLRVLDAFTVYFIDFPHEFIQLIHLRYLSFTYNDDISPEIAQLQKLQVLMVRREPKIIFVGVSFLPDEIWEMPELRHLWFTETDFPALPIQVAENRVLLLNLQTLSNVNAAFFTDEVLDNMPSLKKLSMWIETPDKIEFNLDKLSQLEFFKFVVLNPIAEAGKGIEIDPERFFPKTLKRLNLTGCGLPWECMEIVAKLPDLEVLKLRELAFYGEEWSLTDKFMKLKYLLIEYLNFEVWEASVEHFPKLERLILRHCYKLEIFPYDFAFIKQLELIEVVDCSPDAVRWAEEIQETLEDYGINTAHVRVLSSWE